VGRYLEILHYNDTSWTATHLAALLPNNANELREAAWSSHLINGRGPICADAPEITECYVEEITRLSSNPADVQRDLRQQRLAEYIMILMLLGTLQSPLLDRFLELAPADVRRRAMWFVGEQVSLPRDQLPEDVRKRGLAYWELRLAAATKASNPADYGPELGVIDHWCSHGVVDEVWLSDQLLGMLGIGILPISGYHTLQWLRELTGRYLDRAVEILLGLIRHAETNRWIYMTNYEAIRAILSEGRGRGATATVNRVRSIVSHLASLGDSRYLDLDIPEPLP
jgi:hypothetical protein